MIVEWFIDLWAGICEWFLSLFPQDDPPEFLNGIAEFFGTITGNAAGLGAWLPWAWLGLVGGTILGLWVVLWSVKGVRWVWGLTPFSGGS